jgi:hypothetical protein
MPRDIFPRQQGGADTFGNPAPCAVNSTDVDRPGPLAPAAGHRVAIRSGLGDNRQQTRQITAGNDPSIQQPVLGRKGISRQEWRSPVPVVFWAILRMADLNEAAGAADATRGLSFSCGEIDESPCSRFQWEVYSIAVASVHHIHGAQIGSADSTKVPNCHSISIDQPRPPQPPAASF